jgi:hypothetical protein
MATAKSDDDGDDRQPHPLAQNRPGVYVQVVGTPRKRKAERARLDVEAASAAPPAESAGPARESLADGEQRSSGVEPSPRVPSAGAPEQVSGTRSLEPEARRDYSFGSAAPHSAAPVELVTAPGAGSENTNHRADLMKVPGPPRMPSISLSGAPLPPKQQGASLLDAPRSLRPDSLPTEKKTSWALLAFVATLSAIITAAAVVAVRERSGPPDESRQSPADAPVAAGQEGTNAPRAAQPAQGTAAAAPAVVAIEPAAAAVELQAAPSVEPQQAAAPAPSAAPVPAAAPVAPPPPVAAAAPVAPPAPVAAAAPPAPVAAPARAAPVAAAQQAPHKPAAAHVRRPAPVANPGAPALTPAQMVAEHARSLAPVELPVSTDTSLPANPYEPSEQ